MQMKFLSLFKTTLLIVSASAFLSIAGCSEQKDEQTKPAGMHPASVSVISVSKQTVPFAIELPATLLGGEEVEVRARVSGILESRNFIEGEEVKAGTSLFSIDSKPYAIELSRAEAQLAVAKARLQQAEHEVTRLMPLRKKNTVSQQQYDNAISEQAVMQAELKTAKANVAKAQLNVEYSKVVAPIDGVIGRAEVSNGSYISGPAQLLTNLTNVTKMRLRFGISQREQLAMRKEAELGELTLPANNQWKTRLKLQDGSFYDGVGQVNFSDVRINANTGTSEYQAIIDNPNKQLHPGQFVRVLLDGASRENAIVVPQRAVLDSGTGKFVYVMVSNEKGMSVAKPAPIEVGEWVKLTQNGKQENAWVIRKGLNVGDKVIVDGVARIFFPGMPVQLATANSKG
jgi:membrane fusion protein (multidrug efflux system)